MTSEETAYFVVTYMAREHRLRGRQRTPIGLSALIRPISWCSYDIKLDSRSEMDMKEAKARTRCSPKGT